MPHDVRTNVLCTPSQADVVVHAVHHVEPHLLCIQWQLHSLQPCFQFLDMCRAVTFTAILVQFVLDGTKLLTKVKLALPVLHLGFHLWIGNVSNPMNQAGREQMSTHTFD